MSKQWETIFYPIRLRLAKVCFDLVLQCIKASVDHRFCCGFDRASSDQGNRPADGDLTFVLQLRSIWCIRFFQRDVRLRVDRASLALTLDDEAVAVAWLLIVERKGCRVFAGDGADPRFEEPGVMIGFGLR